MNTHQNKIDIYSKKKVSNANGRPKLTPKNEKHRKIPQAFSLRREVIEQLNFARDEIGINVSAVVEKQIINYLRRINFWPPPENR